MKVYELIVRQAKKVIVEDWDGFDYHMESPMSLDDEAEVTVYLINCDKSEKKVVLQLKGADDGDEEDRPGQGGTGSAGRASCDEDKLHEV